MMLKHCGLLWSESEDGAGSVLKGIFDRESLRLQLKLESPENSSQAIEKTVPAATVTALFGTLGALLEELGVLKDLPDSERELLRQWSRCFGSLPLTEFEVIGECYEDIVTAYSGSPEAEKRLVQHVSQARSGTLRDTFLRVALGERPTCRPIFARALTLLGLSLGDFGLAEQGYAAMKQSGSGATPLLRARVALELAQARLLREHSEGYAALIKQAYELTPDDPVVIRQRGTAQLLSEDWSAALETWSSLSEKSPNDFHCRYALAQAYEGLGQLEQALENYERLIGDLSKGELTEDKKDFLVTALGHMSGLQVSLGRHDELAEMARHYAPIFSREPNLINVLVSSLFMIYKYEEGKRLLDASLEQAPDNTLAYVLKSRSLLALGQAEEAIKSARKAVELDDEQSLWKISLAEALVEGNEHKEASLIFAQLAKNAGGEVPSATYMCLQAGKHETDGEVFKADEIYRQALGAHSESHFARSEYGAFLISQERVLEAVDLLTTLLEMAPAYLPGLMNLQTALILVLKNPETNDVDKERCQAVLLKVNERLSKLAEEK